MEIKQAGRDNNGECLPPALEGVDKPTFAHSNNQEQLVMSLSRCGQTGLPTPRATPIFKQRRIQAKPDTINPALPTQYTHVRASIIFRDKTVQSRRTTSADFVMSFVATYHPDFRYDQKTRALIHLNHPSAVWLQWEELKFDPKQYPSEYRFFMEYAEEKGYDFWAQGPVDLRRIGIVASAAMALYEFEQLVTCVESTWGKGTPKIQNDDEIPPSVWRHLYWFTRFYRAWQRIGKHPGGYSKKSQDAVKAARLWREAAWKHYCEMFTANPDIKLKAVALDFLESYAPGGVNEADVHKWIQKRRNKSLGTPPPQKAK